MNEVLELKEKCYAEVKHLSLEETLKKRIDDSLISAEVYKREVLSKNSAKKHKTKNTLPE